MEQNNLFKEYKDIFKEEEASPSKEKKERTFGYNPFALQDALGEKSAKKAWIEYEKLRLVGIDEEEIVYKIMSKVRDMAAIIIGASKEDLNLKDYPYNKSKKDLKNWKEEELKNLYTKLVEMYHNSRIKGDDLDIALEEALLSL
jgi:DNA polymerase III delta subunit